MDSGRILKWSLQQRGWGYFSLVWFFMHLGNPAWQRQLCRQEGSRGQALNLSAVMLYHGSPTKVSRLEPRPARGVGPDHDMLTAVYATDVRNMAIAFAMSGVADEEGHLSWTLEMEGDLPRIEYQAGHPRYGEQGYVYTLSPEGFVQVAPHQWVSYAAVTPVLCETVNIDDYLSWVRVRDSGERRNTG